MKTKTKLSAYILRGSMNALLFSCVIVALCWAVNLPIAKGRASAASVAASAIRTSRPLTFAERVAYQTAIEDVYWRHRIWPKANPGPKPSLDAVMSQADIQKKVEGYLRNSQTLDAYWQRPARNASHPPAAMQQLRAGNDVGGPITADQLQAEMERMARDTKQPEVLQELFEALGNDPFVIAECLARPVLAERLVGEFSSGAKDASFRAKSRLQRSGRSPRGQAFNPAARLTANSTRSFDFAQDDIAANLANAAYTLPEIANPSGGCTDDTWTPTTLTDAPSGRYQHTAVWTGSEMIVWGGRNGSTFFNTGWRYNPIADSWTATTATNAPTGRATHTAVWTGSEMIVWGGVDGSNYFNTGGRYDPGTDSWTATSTINAPAPRSYPYPSQQTAVWTGTEMIVWGGFGDSGALNTGGRYNPSSDSWTSTSLTNAPAVRYEHTLMGTGNIALNSGGRYCASAAGPTPTPTSSPTPTATATPTASATATVTATATPTATPTSHSQLHAQADCHTKVSSNAGGSTHSATSFNAANSQRFASQSSAAAHPTASPHTAAVT